MKSKITRYKKYLPAMEEKVGRKLTVLFVIDVDRIKVKEFVGRMQNLLAEPVFPDFSGDARFPFFFTDYNTFKSVPLGNALKLRIYFWHDGKEWRLTNDD
jgi:hypothetical protein